MRLRCELIVKLAMKTNRILWGLIALVAYWQPTQSRAEGTWVPLATQPAEGIQTVLVLQNGTVMAAPGSSTNATQWYKLTPDSNGHYINGTWSTRAAANYGRLYFASTVLPSGRVVVCGGEYGNGRSHIEMYDAYSDYWSDEVDEPASLAEGNSVLLQNGQVLYTPQANSGGKTYLIDPATFTPVATGKSLEDIGEASWVKLPDFSILTIDSGGSASGATTAERYVPSSGAWTDASGSGVPNIWADFSATPDVAECGPATLLPNGNAIFFGGNGNTAVYNPASGSWSQGPTIPSGDVCADAPCAMMNNGKVLIQAGPAVDTSSGEPVWASSSSFFEYDYAANSGAGGFTQVHAPGGGLTRSEVTYAGRMLDLPDGTILWCDGGSQLYVYQPDGVPLAAGVPVIDSVATNGPGLLWLTGTGFGGLTQGASYGDDAQMDSNFPLVQFVDANGVIRYGFSELWSDNVQAGSAVSAVMCVMPPGASLNDTIRVTVNGSVSSGVHYPLWGGYTNWVDFNYSGFSLGVLPFPWKTMADAVSFATPGTVISVKAGSGATPINITKPVRIVSSGGTAHIGP